MANLTFLATVRYSLLNNIDNIILADFKEEEEADYDKKKSELLDYGLCKFGSYSGSIIEGDDKESFKGKMTFNNCEYAFSKIGEKVVLNGELDYTTNKTNEISNIKNFKVSISEGGDENEYELSNVVHNITLKVNGVGSSELKGDYFSNTTKNKEVFNLSVNEKEDGRIKKQSSTGTYLEDNKSFILDIEESGCLIKSGGEEHTVPEC